jgi:hypothetical protein
MFASLPVHCPSVRLASATKSAEVPTAVLILSSAWATLVYEPRAMFDIGLHFRGDRHLNHLPIESTSCSTGFVLPLIVTLQMACPCAPVEPKC